MTKSIKKGYNKETLSKHWRKLFQTEKSLNKGYKYKRPHHALFRFSPAWTNKARKRFNDNSGLVTLVTELPLSFWQRLYAFPHTEKRKYVVAQIEVGKKRYQFHKWYRFILPWYLSFISILLIPVFIDLLSISHSFRDSPCNDLNYLSTGCKIWASHNFHSSTTFYLLNF